MRIADRSIGHCIYYCVSDITVHPNQWNEMKDWLSEQFGPTAYINFDQRWYVNNAMDTVFFSNEEDRNWFLLRWS